MTLLGKRFLAILLSLTLSVAFLETALRLVKARPAYADTSVDNLFDGYRLPEGWWEPRESPEIVRVLVLGDSFTWGDGVHQEDAYAHRMEFRMNLADPARRYRTLNAGRNGFNTVDMRRLLDTMGLLQSEPDLVLLGFTLNDPEPSDRTQAEAMKTATKRRQPVGRVELDFYRRSRLFRFVYDRLENTRQRRAFNEYVAALFDEESPHWRACEEALVSLRDHLGQRGIPFVVALLPAFDSQFDEHYPYRRQHEQFMAALARLDVPGVDLWSLYEGVEARRLAVTPFTDAHPNELAHRIAGDFLAAWVSERLTVTVDAGGRQRSWREGVAP